MRQYLGKALAASKKLPPFQPPQDLDVDSLEVCSVFKPSSKLLIYLGMALILYYQAASWAGKTFKAAGKTPKPGEKTPKKTKDDEGLLVRRNISRTIPDCCFQVKKKTIKKRKKKLPKNYNPNVDPDPERWLPKKERTGLKWVKISIYISYSKVHCGVHVVDFTSIPSLGTCLVGTGSQGRTRGNQRSSPAHRARMLENLRHSITAENSQLAERPQENKPVRNPRLQPLDQEPSRRCRRMQTRGRRREERSSSEWSFLHLIVFNYQCCWDGNAAYL